MTIALLRHGETDWNRAKRVQGRTDVPLNSKGQEQARAVAKRLVSEEWHTITSSPLLRARETAEIIAEQLGIELLDPMDDLIEQDYGVAEGSFIHELEERWPGRNFPEGESAAEVADRAFRTINLLGEAHAGERVLVVTHGAYIRRTVATLTSTEYSEVPKIDNVSITEVLRDSNGWQILSINNLAVAENWPAFSGYHPAERDIVAQQAKAADLAIAPTINLSNLTIIGDDAATCTVDGVCY